MKSIEKTKDNKFPAAVAIIVFLILIIVIISVCFALSVQKYEYEQKLREAENAVPAMVVSNDPEPVVKKYEISADYLKNMINSKSRLETTEVLITGICSFEEGNNFLTKNSYSMLYNASVQFYVDVKGIEFQITEKEVIITLPKAQMQQPVIDEDSVRFYDVKKSWFNPIELSDAIDSMRLARSDIEENYDFTQALENADEQAEYIIRAMFTDIVKQADGERDLRIEWKENDSEEQ